MLRLPRATYRYLRVTIDGLVPPADVQGATSQMAEQHPPVWRSIGNVQNPAQDGKDTVFAFSISENVPVDRVVLNVAASPVTNFRRDVEIRDEKDNWIGSGNIER